MVSIVIALYNGAQYIEQTIKAVLEQTYTDIEIIVIDDCSGDDSANIIRELSYSDSRITYKKNDKNSGFCISANKGVKLAKGEYVLVLGQDDLLKKEHISSMLNLFHNEKVGIVYCEYELINEKNEVFDESSHCLQRDLFIQDFICNNAMPSCGAIVRKAYFEEVNGYPEFPEYPQYGEWYLWIKMVEKYQILFNNNIKSQYRRHQSNLTNSFCEKSVEVQLNKYWDKCRKRAFNSSELKMRYKIKGMLYVIYQKLKRK